MVISKPVPIISNFKRKLATLVSDISGLSKDQAYELIEIHYDSQADFIIPITKIRRFKPDEDIELIAQTWQAKFVSNDWFLSCNLVSIIDKKKPFKYLQFKANYVRLISMVLSRIYEDQDTYGLRRSDNYYRIFFTKYR